MPIPDRRPQGLMPAALLVLAASCSSTAPERPEPSAPRAAAVQRPTTERGNADVIRVQRPQPADRVGSPLRVSGEARGGWYFEATFPVRLLDARGQKLVESYAQARGEWMTSEYVPFELELRFSGTPGESATLVLEKANASGLPEHADELRIPLVLGPAAP